MENLFENELLDGEKILWTGEPENKGIFESEDIFLIPFSILWSGFAITWEFLTIFFKAPIFFPIFGIPFVLIGIYLLFGRFIYRKISRKNTSYAVTNKRIMILVTLFGENLKSESIKNIKNVEKRVNKKGLGKITFTNDYFVMNKASSDTSYGTMGFYQIWEVNEVYKIIMDIKNRD